MRRPVLLAATLVSLAGLDRVAFAEPSHDNLALGADIGVVARGANGAGVTYRPGVAFGAHVDIPLVSWLTVSAYYLNTRQPAEIDSVVALGTTAPISHDGSLSSYVLGARVQPTYVVNPRLQLWVSAGASWGVLGLPRVTVAAPDPYTIATPDHPFVELPFGVGGRYEVVPKWVGVQLIGTYGVTIGEPAAASIRLISQGGHVVQTTGLPGFCNAFTALLGVVVEL